MAAQEANSVQTVGHCERRPASAAGEATRGRRCRSVRSKCQARHWALIESAPPRPKPLSGGPDGPTYYPYGSRWASHSAVCFAVRWEGGCLPERVLAGPRPLPGGQGRSEICGMSWADGGPFAGAASAAPFRTGALVGAGGLGRGPSPTTGPVSGQWRFSRGLKGDAGATLQRVRCPLESNGLLVAPDPCFEVRRGALSALASD